jgi:hypothetical protein
VYVLEENYARKLIVCDPDDEGGPVCVITPGSITLEGGSGRGFVVFGFDPKDGAAGMALASPDGKFTTKLRAAKDGQGVTVKRGDQETTLEPNRIVLSDKQRAVLCDAGIICNDDDGEPVFEVPFLQSAFVRELTEHVVREVKAWLAEKLKLPAASR